MIENVTRDEVIAAAKESTLAAVECCMKHWLYNANITDIGAADLIENSCALCEKGKNTHQVSLDFDLYPKCSNCPLKDAGHFCCQEYSEATAYNYRGLENLNGFKAAAARLYTRLATIREKLLAEQLLAEQLKTIPPKPLRIPIKIGNKYRNKLSNKVYMLASTGNYEVALVDIDTGERLRSNRVVGNVLDISDLEFYQISRDTLEYYQISGDTVVRPKNFELVHGRIVFDS